MKPVDRRLAIANLVNEYSSKHVVGKAAFAEGELADAINVYGQIVGDDFDPKKLEAAIANTILLRRQYEVGDKPVQNESISDAVIRMADLLNVSEEISWGTDFGEVFTWNVFDSLMDLLK